MSRLHSSGHENCVPRSRQLKARPTRQMQTFEVRVHQVGQEKGSDLIYYAELQASSVADLLISWSQTCFVQKMAEEVISWWARRRLAFSPFSCHSPICVSNMRLACQSCPVEGSFQPLVQRLTWLASLCLRAWSLNLVPAVGALHGEISRHPVRLSAHLSPFPFQSG